MALNNKTYGVLKWIALYLLPALGTLYFALSGIWNLPYGEQVVGTITAIDTFLGVLLGISSAKYNGEGTLVVNTDDAEKVVYSLNLNVPLEELANMNTITFKVDSDVKE